MNRAPHLDAILDAVRRRAAARRARYSLADLRGMTRPDPRRRERFLQALHGEGLAIIAECKRRSPSAGALSGEVDLRARARAYEEGGAAALSILTEEEHFSGSLADLSSLAGGTLPCLRKDFLLDESMVLESLLAGADAILLLAVCLEPSLLAELRALAGEIGLAVLLEVHDEAELERAEAAAPDCLGVNARDLRTLQVQPAVLDRLLPCIPARYLRVAESGLRAPADFARVRARGADAALVGEALMRSPDPAADLRRFRAAAAACPERP